MTLTCRFTKAQLRAFDWLPSDGSWRVIAGRVGPAVSSLGVFHRELAESGWGNFGPRSGYAWRWRLTKAGVDMKASLISEGLLFAPSDQPLSVSEAS